MTLKFGKFKGQEFQSTPQWYQDWLLKQDWFKAPTNVSKKESQESYALVEDGAIHTSDLSLEDANEMRERHARCFPNNSWVVLTMSQVYGMDKLEGMLQRHARISAMYSPCK